MEYNWWYEELTISSPNDEYNSTYFEHVSIHVSDPKHLVKHILNHIDIYPKSVLVVGCGGGWNLNEFLKLGIDAIGIEGSQAGIAKAESEYKIGNKIILHDLRREINLNRKFDLIVCMEVAEHLEPPFASMLVNTLCKHGDTIYFTSCKPRKKHSHHPNEQYPKYWEIIFNFYGFSLYKEIQEPNEFSRYHGFIYKKI